jgi:hypothetical protein
MATNANAVNGGTKTFGSGMLTNNNPLFASETAPYDVHLKSQAGRWDPATSTWTQDAADSPCIDTGDPASDWSLEPLDNGFRINMGRYGNTEEASKTAPAPDAGPILRLR